MGRKVAFQTPAFTTVGYPVGNEHLTPYIMCLLLQIALLGLARDGPGIQVLDTFLPGLFSGTLMNLCWIKHLRVSG